jgi:single-stranded-DNA-specific exonuclease
MADAQDVITLFLTADDAIARDIAEKLHGLNQERQETEAEIVAAILEQCERTPVDDSHSALVFCAPGWHRGVLGIVASRLVERFCRPAFVLGEEDGLAQGSGRSIAPFHLLDALESMREMFSRFGGHAMAAGLTLPQERVSEFRQRFNEYASSRLTPEDFRPHVAVDAEITFTEVNDGSVEEILSLAPFGAGNPSPLFAVRNAEVCEPPNVFKDKHLRLRLRNNGRALMMKAWNFAGRIDELQPGVRVDAVVSFDEDLFSYSRGYSPWSVQLRDLRPAGMLE